MYCAKAELSEQIKIYQTKGYISERLVEIIDAMTNGIYKKYHQNQAIDYDDYRQGCWVMFMRKYMKCDISKNCFAYWTSVFLNELRQRHRSLRTGIQLEFIDFTKLQMMNNDYTDD